MSLASFGNVGSRGGRLCDSRDSCQASARAASHGRCPASLVGTWDALDGFAPDISLAMRCHEDGGWLAPGVQQYRPMYHGINRSASFRVTRQFCHHANEWSYFKKRPRGPPIFGTDGGIRTAYSRNQSLTGMLLRLSMGRPWDLNRLGQPPSSVSTLYTTCQNLAFTLCAARGWLPNQGGSNVYLATTGSRLGETCQSCASFNYQTPRL